MNRRQFLTRGLAITAAGVLIPTRSIFLPPAGGWPTSQELGYWYSGINWHLRMPGELDAELLERMLQNLANAYQVPVRYLTGEIDVSVSEKDIEAYSRYSRNFRC